MRFGGVMIWMSLLVAVPEMAAAQDTSPACATPAPLPPELVGWAAPTPLTAAATSAELDAAVLAPGRAVAARLGQAGDVRYIVRPEKPGGSASYGGMFGFEVAEAGTWRIALGSAAWVDVLEGQTAIASSAHGHGPACSGIRKMVDFPLQPGRYVVQVAANGTPDLTLMVARLP